jgi:hypothetical protein
VLLAIRDFDLNPGEPPATPDFMPEDNLDAAPRVAVHFRMEAGDIEALQEDIDFPEFLKEFSAVTDVWVERELLTGKYEFDENVKQMWLRAEAIRDANLAAVASALSPEPDEEEDEDDVPDTTTDEGEEDDAEPLTLDDFSEILRHRWPSFVYFDTFSDTLPRQVDLDATLSAKSSASIPQAVRDFIALADIDLAKVKALAAQDKALGNYLDGRGASITGDFLTYWQQKVDGQQNVYIRVRHVRDEGGKLKLAFYIRDQVDQYPEQRSKGFVWFLSFFLRLAAERKHRPDSKRLLLIDEPGSYLHARAQRDVLHLFETRIAPNEQIIYSSHSPFLMPSHTLHRVRIVLKSASRGSRVYDRLTHPDLRGQDFADTLTPLIEAIGIDVSQAFTFHRPKNLLVEGITDHLYVTTWATLFAPTFVETVNVLPGFGATTLLTLASLFIGWGQPFAVLLDRDEEGLKTRDRFSREFLIPEARLVLPKDATTIEDLFSHEDLRGLLAALDGNLTLEPNESASAALKRRAVDKVLLAGTYAERTARDDVALTKKTQQRIEKLFADLNVALQ